MRMFFNKPPVLPQRDQTLAGRDEPIALEPIHYVSGNNMCPPFPTTCASIVLGMGCFWGAERVFWQLDGVYVTSVGYAGGITPNPTYEEVCSGLTAHTEVVQIVYDPAVISLSAILKVFWEKHDPTQGMRQGNDTGTQYRSAIYYTDAEDLSEIETSLHAYSSALNQSGFTAITTEIKRLDHYYYAETYHQQYLAKNPNGYCGIGGTGVSCPI